MTAPVDPNAPLQEVGETATNYQYRLQQYAYSLGAGPSGQNPGMAQQWLGLVLAGNAPSGFQIK